MKKLKSKLGILSVAALTLVLAGCNLIPGKDQTQTTGDNQSMIEEPLSEDTDLKTVEEELNDTELEEFDSELNGLNQEINKL